MICLLLINSNKSQKASYRLKIIAAMLIKNQLVIKKDKKHGENIKWNLIENEILQEYSHALEDIKK